MTASSSSGTSCRAQFSSGVTVEHKHGPELAVARCKAEDNHRPSDGIHRRKREHYHRHCVVAGGGHVGHTTSSEEWIVIIMGKSIKAPKD